MLLHQMLLCYGGILTQILIDVVHSARDDIISVRCRILVAASEFKGWSEAHGSMVHPRPLT